MPEFSASSASVNAVTVCASADLVEGGKGMCFDVQIRGHATTGFVVRFQDAVHSYLNQCAHVPIELDWTKGEFFESSGLYLMCATHGAIYDPETGHCLGGPCRGGRLRKLRVHERDGAIFWQPDADVQQSAPNSPTISSIPILPAGTSS